MDSGFIEIRHLRSVEEFQQAEPLQQAVWEMPDGTDAVPLHLLITAQKNGGLVLGAFDGDKLVGFLFGFLGRTPDGKIKHCSHQMGILASYRGQGIGGRLKARQREFVLEQGLDLVTWTYDPLERVNAYLNIAKLGAVCRSYLRNVYGELRDELNRGMPTDRFQVEWWVRSTRVAERLQALQEGTHKMAERMGLVAGLPQANQVPKNAGGLREPLGWQLLDEPEVLVEIPASIQQVKSRDISLARAWRDSTRALFEGYFQAGYTVVDFVALPHDGERRYFYLLARTLELE